MISDSLEMSPYALADVDYSQIPGLGEPQESKGVDVNKVNISKK